MPAIPRVEMNLKQRFDDKWCPEPFSGCWLWTGSPRICSFVYGEIVIRNKHFLAHRISWMLYKGEIPDGLDVLHRCDTPLCVNPDHLFLGTHNDNMADMVKKGRKSISRGECVANSKLKESEVREIRRLYTPGKTTHKNDYGVAGLARRFNVSEPCVSFIVNRKTWRHIGD